MEKKITISKSEQSYKIGILGGGQLGQMLAQDMIYYGVHVYFLSNFGFSQNDEIQPCSIYNSAVNGSITTYEDVIYFGENLDVITVEIENVNTEALKTLEKQGVKVFPQPHALEVIKDKGKQKMFYAQHNIPTAKFTLVDSISEANVEKVLEEIGVLNAFVQKYRTGGYDGKGVKVYEKTDIQSIVQGEIQEDSLRIPSVIEEKLDIKQELSIIVSRNIKGQIECFPITECIFNHTLNLLDYLVSPADITGDIQQEIEHIAKHIITKLSMVGILCIEFILTKEDVLYVNEMAPRPHNSGHHTIESCTVSQYGQLTRCLLDLPLAKPKVTAKYSAILNVLGQDDDQYPNANIPKLLAIEGVFLHLYGKGKSKHGRKMGHVTVLGDDREELEDKIQMIKSLF